MGDLSQTLNKPRRRTYNESVGRLSAPKARLLLSFVFFVAASCRTLQPSGASAGPTANPEETPGEPSPPGNLTEPSGPPPLEKRIIPEISLNEFEQRLTFDSRLRLSDRVYVTSAFSNAFGTKGAAIANEMIASSDGFFGGPCDPKAQDCVAPYATGQSDSPMVPLPLIGRTALTIRACDSAVADDEALKAALTNLTNAPIDLEATPPTRTDIAQMYDLFFPGLPPTPEALDALQSVAQKAQEKFGNPQEQWRFVVYAICIMPDWQIP